MDLTIKQPSKILNNNLEEMINLFYFIEKYNIKATIKKVINRYSYAGQKEDGLIPVNGEEVPFMIDLELDLSVAEFNHSDFKLSDNKVINDILSISNFTLSPYLITLTPWGEDTKIQGYRLDQMVGSKGFVRFVDENIDLEQTDFNNFYSKDINKVILRLPYRTTKLILSNTDYFVNLTVYEDSIMKEIKYNFNSNKEFLYKTNVSLNMQGNKLSRNTHLVMIYLTAITIAILGKRNINKILTGSFLENLNFREGTNTRLRTHGNYSEIVYEKQHKYQGTIEAINNGYIELLSNSEDPLLVNNRHNVYDPKQYTLIMTGTTIEDFKVFPYFKINQEKTVNYAETFPKYPAFKNLLIFNEEEFLQEEVSSIIENLYQEKLADIREHWIKIQNFIKSKRTIKKLNEITFAIMFLKKYLFPTITQDYKVTAYLKTLEKTIPDNIVLPLPITFFELVYSETFGDFMNIENPKKFYEAQNKLHAGVYSYSDSGRLEQLIDAQVSGVSLVATLQSATLRLTDFGFRANDLYNHFRYEDSINYIIINDSNLKVGWKAKVRAFCKSFINRQKRATFLILTPTSKMEEIKIKKVYSERDGVILYSESIANNRLQKKEIIPIADQSISLYHDLNRRGNSLKCTGTISLSNIIANPENYLLIGASIKNGATTFRGNQIIIYNGLRTRFVYWFELIKKLFNKKVIIVNNASAKKIRKVAPDIEDFMEFIYDTQNHPQIKQYLESRLFLFNHFTSFRGSHNISRLFTIITNVFLKDGYNSYNTNIGYLLMYKAMEWLPQEYQNLLDKLFIFKQGGIGLGGFSTENNSNVFMEPNEYDFDKEIIDKLILNPIFSMTEGDIKNIEVLIKFFDEFRSTNNFPLDFNTYIKIQTKLLLEKHNLNLSNDEYLKLRNSADKLLLFTWESNRLE